MTKTERDACVVEHLPIVRGVVNRLQRRLFRVSIIDRDDLLQSGVLGLLDAMDKYRPDCGTSFSTYCRYRIGGEVLDCIRDTLRTAGTMHEELNEETAGSAGDTQHTARVVLLDELRKSLPLEENKIIGELLAGLSLPEAAQRCQLTEGRANYLKFSAIARMRAQVAKRR